MFLVGPDVGWLAAGCPSPCCDQHLCAFWDHEAAVDMVQKAVFCQLLSPKAVSATDCPKENFYQTFQSITLLNPCIVTTLKNLSKPLRGVIY